jgi:hypothetical protein
MIDRGKNEGGARLFPNVRKMSKEIQFSEPAAYIHSLTHVYRA